jgi:hypothetical protein
MLDAAGEKFMAGGKAGLATPDHNGIDSLEHPRHSAAGREPADPPLTFDVEAHEVHAVVIDDRKHESGVAVRHNACSRPCSALSPFDCYNYRPWLLADRQFTAYQRTARGHREGI